jgi:hypothetical protein
VTTLSALYAAQPLVVWVEDEETRRVLTTAWAGESVAIYVGGGNETIRAVVEDAWRGDLRHVFGVVDRDFGRSNSGHWQNPGDNLRVYVLESAEIENLALDPEALAACDYNTGRRSKQQIEKRMMDAVADMVWWMACCSVLDVIRRRRNAGFPSFPRHGAAVVDLSSALQYIQSSPWFSQYAAQLPALATRDWLEAELESQRDHFSNALHDGTWKTEFSGKQLFDRVVEFVHTKGTGRGKKLELLQGVVQAQIDLGIVPQELERLKASLFSRR